MGRAQNGRLRFAIATSARKRAFPDSANGSRALTAATFANELSIANLHAPTDGYHCGAALNLHALETVVVAVGVLRCGGYFPAAGLFGCAPGMPILVPVGLPGPG